MSALPEHLIAIGKLLATQDGQCTSHPMFLVQVRTRLYGFDPTWGGEVAWLNDGDEAEASEAAKLEAAYQETGDEPGEWTRTGFIDRWEFVTCGFTDAAARAYIEANKHRLDHPRVYVDSAYRNTEFIAVREYLLAAGRGAA